MPRNVQLELFVRVIGKIATLFALGRATDEMRAGARFFICCVLDALPCEGIDIAWCETNPDWAYFATDDIDPVDERHIGWRAGYNLAQTFWLDGAGMKWAPPHLYPKCREFIQKDS